MTKDEVVGFWVSASDEAWDTAEKLVGLGKRSDGLFFAHLAVEKIIKALFYDKKDDNPPPIHNLDKLAKNVGTDITQEQLDELKEITGFNVSARYDDYKRSFYKKATMEYTSVWIKKAKHIRDYFKSLIFV